MKTAPLQLLSYVVPDVSSSAVMNYNAEKPSDYTAAKFTVKTDVTAKEAPAEVPGKLWSVSMSISYQVPEKTNLPYNLEFQIFGFFACAAKMAPDLDEETLVKVNGSSVLYGVAREMIRSITSAGPWGSFMLPTVSFNERPTTSTTPKKPRNIKKA